MAAEEYREALDTSELIDELHGLIAVRRRSLWLMCRYLADLADRPRADLEGGDVYLFAWRELGIPRRRARERIRVGRALRRLPTTEARFREGKVGFARVREIVRVATPETESEWLDAARALSRSQLEELVARASLADPPGSRPDTPPPVRDDVEADSERYEIQLRLRGSTWRRLVELLEAARATEGADLSEEAALDVVIREAHRVLTHPVPNLGDPERGGRNQSDGDPMGSPEPGADPMGSPEPGPDPIGSPEREAGPIDWDNPFGGRPAIRQVGAAPDCALAIHGGESPSGENTAATPAAGPASQPEDHRAAALPEDAQAPDATGPLDDDEVPVPLSPAARRLLEVLAERRRCSANLFGAVTGFDGSTLAAGLAELEVWGLATRFVGGSYGISRELQPEGDD